MRVLVIGAGVTGLTTAHELVHNGYRVTVLAKEFMAPDNSSKITSQVAGAIWQVPLSSDSWRDKEVEKDAKAWCLQSYKRYIKLAENSQATGIYERTNVYLYKYMIKDSPKDERFMKAHKDLPGFRHSSRILEEKGITGSGLVDAFTFRGPVIDTDVFLCWLTGQLQSKGVDFVRRTICGSLEDQSEPLKTKYNVDWIVNCCGLASREVVEDKDLYPLRGAGLIVRKADCTFRVPDFTIHSASYWYEGEHNGKGYVLIVPRGEHSLWLGTCMQESSEKTLDVSHPIIRRMLQECKALYPPLQHITEEQLGITVGVRPMRKGSPRVEQDPRCSTIIHNYGHSACGVMLSWGCAEHVVRIISRLRPTSKL